MTRVSGFSSGLAILSSTLLLAFAIGCNGNGHSGATNPTPPASSVTVSSVQPAAGATGVATNAPIQIVFSSAVNAATVDAADIKVTNSTATAIAGAITYNSTTNTATFTPSAALATSAQYTVTVTGVTSSGGGMMSSSFTSTFTTAGPQYQATFYPSGGTNGGGGQISMDSAGNMTVELTGAAASAMYTLQFCPSEQAGGDPIVCTNVGTVTTSASGSADSTMLFPNPGSWAGDFQLNIGSNSEYVTNMNPAASAPNQVYMATLQPETTANGTGVIMAGGSPQAPLKSGTVTYSSGSLQFVLTGTSPNTAFSAGESTNYLGSSSSYLLYNSQGQANFTTDAQGDVTFSVLQDNVTGDLFTVVPQGNAIGFIGGFSVPNK